MTTQPRVLILHAPGTNRDREAALACQLAGGAPEIVHLNQLVGGAYDLASYQMLVLPGGFSYGGDLGAGRLLANDLAVRFRPALDAFVEAGKPVMGISDGFQALVKAGYLPGPAPTQRVTLTFNRSGHTECRWVRLRAQGQSACLFTRGLLEDIVCPVAHSEGRLALPDETTRQALWREGLVALTYVTTHCETNPSCKAPVCAQAGYPNNPNGSIDDIAGLCNAAGNVFGLMPHPEDHVFAEQHPQWTRGEAGGLGIELFRNGIKAAQAFV